jgi:DHA2 family multidrug resistance protein
MQAHALIYNTLLSQSSLWAFVENFRIFGGLCLLCLPLVLLFKRVKRGPGGTVVH